MAVRPRAPRRKLTAASAALLAVLLAGAALRFGRIDSGLPAVFLPDEELVTKNALSLGARKSLRPLYTDYPTFEIYLLAGLYGGLFVAGRVAGVYASPTDFGVRFFVDPTPVYLLGRASSALFGVGAMLVVFLLGRRLYGTRAGLLGALLLGLAVEAAREAGFATPNAPLSFLSILAFLPICAVAERGRVRDAALAGAAIGLSVSAKYNSGLLVLALAVALFAPGRARPRAGLAHAAAAAAAALAVFLAITPYWLLGFRDYLDGYRLQASHMRTGHLGAMGETPIVWALRAIARQERTGGLLAIAGTLFALARRTPGDRLLAAFVVPSFLIVSGLKNQQLDYLAFLWPPAALLGGRLLDSILRAGPLARRGALAALAGGALVAPSAAAALAELRAARAPDTRNAARAWIEANVPPGSAIAFDRYHYAAPLLDAGRAQRSEVGRRYVGADFGAALETALGSRPTYRLVPITLVADTLVFPPEVDSLPYPALFRERAARDRFLSVQVFGTRDRSVDELIAEDAEYLLLSSKWLDRFLAQPPPPRDNPLYAYWARERRHFESMLRDPRVREVRRWEPGAGLVGPRVVLYRIDAS